MYYRTYSKASNETFSILEINYFAAWSFINDLWRLSIGLLKFFSAIWTFKERASPLLN